MKSRNKRILIGAVFVLTLAASLFFVGWWYGTKVEGARADRAEAARAELEQEMQRAQAERAALGRRVALLEARVDCARALEALDDRNFGIAEGHLEHAMERLGDTSAAEARRLGGALRLTTAEDLAGQRAQLRGVCGAIDEALASSSGR